MEYGSGGGELDLGGVDIVCGSELPGPNEFGGNSDFEIISGSEYLGSQIPEPYLRHLGPLERSVCFCEA